MDLSEAGRQAGEGHGVGDCSVDTAYEAELKGILDLQEQQSPLNHIEKTFLIKGGASQTIETWLADNERIAMCVLD